MQKIKVRASKGKAWLTADFQQLRQIALELPGFKKFSGDSLVIEMSGKNIECLMKKDIDCNDEARIAIENYASKIDSDKRSKELLLKNASEIDDSGYIYQTKPLDHQKKAFGVSRDLESFAYFMEMGTGKTKVVIDNIAYLYKKGLIQCAIVYAPNGVHQQWVDEQIPCHIPADTDYEAIAYRASDKKTEKRIKQIASDTTTGLKIITFNIESLARKTINEMVMQILRKYKSMMVIDESVRIKSPSAIRTKNAIYLGKSAKYRRIMTGAPVTKGYEDLYSQLNFLDNKILGFNSFYTFRNYYCIMGGFESRQIVGYKPQCIKELEDKLAACSFRVTKKECLDLPEKVYTKRYVELTSQQEDLYLKVKNELAIDLRHLTVAKTDKTEVDTSLMAAITKLLRMQQITCGFFIDEQNNYDLDNNRINVLMECIEEASGKVIVWSRFLRDIEKIKNDLNSRKIGCVVYSGEVSSKNRTEAIDSFRNDPDCKVFIGQPASAGTGLNLQVADTVIYYSNDFNADTRWQSEDRAHRIGQKNHVTYIDLIARKTVDEKILNSLLNKKSMADALLDNPRLLED